MEFLILLDGISTHELMEARLIVEPVLAAHAAERALPSDIGCIRRELREMEAGRSNQAAFVKHDLAFYQAVFRASGNRVCTLMFTVVHELLEKLMAVTSRLVDPAHTITLHRRIYVAIAKGDAAAARRRMGERLKDAQRLLVHFSEQESQKGLHRQIAKLSASANLKKH